MALLILILGLLPSISFAADKFIIITAGPAIEKAVTKKAAEIEKRVGKPLQWATNPADVCMAALQNGRADICTIAIPLQQSLKMAESTGGKKNDSLDAYKIAPVLFTEVKIGVHPDNPVKELTKQQITDILTGKLNNWQSLGWGNYKIKPIFPKKLLMLNIIVPKYFLNAESAPAVEYVGDSQGAVRAIKADPYAMAFISAEESIPDFKPKYMNSGAKYPVSAVMRNDAPASTVQAFELLTQNPEGN